MKLVIVESPYRGDGLLETIQANVRYGRAALADCIARGESPYASHLLLTQAGVLRDEDPIERERGILAGHAWIFGSDFTAVYEDLGISVGMAKGIKRAEKLGKRIEYRALGGEWTALARWREG